LDERLIDSDMLMAEAAEADRIYHELKERSLRSKRAAAKEQMMRQIIEEEEEVIDEEAEKKMKEKQQSDDRMSAQSTKILNILQKSSATERLDFTNGILSFANKQERKYVDSLLPALAFLADDTQDVKKALLNQFIPLIQLVLDNFGDDCYIKVCNTVFPQIEKLLYDKSEEVRDRAISIVAEIRNEVKENEK
jgi:hypothetical protein